VQAIQLIELSEAAVGGLIGGQRIALEPAVATVAIEVVAGIDGLVDERRIEDAQLRSCGRGGLGVKRDAGAGGNLDSSTCDAVSNGSGKVEHAETLADSLRKGQRNRFGCAHYNWNEDENY